MKDDLEQHQQEDIVTVWDSVAEKYNSVDVAEADYKAYMKVICDCTGEPRGKSFCEVGCGSATTSALLAEMGADISLVDLSPKALQFARELFDRQGLKANFFQQDALKMDFPDGKFDVVWNGGVVEHFDDEGKIKLIAEMWRILKPGGILLVKVPNRWDVPFMIYKTWALWRNTWPFGYEDDMTVQRCTLLARKAGVNNFRVFAYNPIVGWWFLKFGKQITQLLGMNTVEWHSKQNRLGHVLCIYALKK